MWIIKINQMDHIPSRSISKSVLLATPFFFLVLAVLHATSELSYLFVLKFVNNVAGSSDITFLPSTKPEISHEAFLRDSTMRQFGLFEESSLVIQQYSMPLVNISEIQTWVRGQDSLLDVSSRWLMPTQVGKTDCILMVMNMSREIDMGIGEGMKLEPMPASQVAVESNFLKMMGLELGDVIPISLKPSNILSGLRMFQKIRDTSSDQEVDLSNVSEMDPQQIGRLAYSAFDVSESGMSEQLFVELFVQLYHSQVTMEFTIRQSFVPNGLYPSVLQNVIIMESEAFSKFLTEWMINSIVVLNENPERASIRDYLPDEYRYFWPNSYAEASIYSSQINSQIGDFLEEWALLMVSRAKSRELVYSPAQGDAYNNFAQTLQQIPGDVEIIAIYPFYKQSLAIKFFFDSVVQIFEFVSCILFFYTISLIMKQIYEEKEIEVGIWRTLGAGGMKIHNKRTKGVLEIEMDQRNGIGNSGNSGKKYVSQFAQSQPLMERIRFNLNLLVKVGFIYYWLLTVVASVILYVLIKLIIYHIVASKLSFDAILQPVFLPFLLFFLAFIFIEGSAILHIQKILTHPLSQTIKPVKRTFDVVKVRIIHIATFGISMQVLLIAVMLIYYGVVSYYWIPFAVLDKDENLQVLLLNTIFVFMIFGAIILLSILQSKFQISLLTLFFLVNKRLKRMKLAILKNIKAKQYKNIKVSIIISLIFAFILFFTAGISIEMQIIESFIERSLGAKLVFENYQEKTFNTTAVNQYLDSKEGVEHSWLSTRLNRGDYGMVFVSHISNEEIHAEIQVLTPPYLNTTFYQYYYPEQYLSRQAEEGYWQLPNGEHDGFNSIYAGINGSESVGKYDPDDTITDIDPKHINVGNLAENPNNQRPAVHQVVIAPEEQVIEMVISKSLRDELGVNVGDQYKFKVMNYATGKYYYMRSRITHSFKAGPGFDLLHQQAFISQQQADYIYKLLEAPPGEVTKNQKLFIKGSDEALKGIGNAIIAMSPEHTQMFQLGFVSQTFSLLAEVLDGYVVMITVIMSLLAVLFLFLYTLGKCREEAEMYKMLRAIGLSVGDIRIMVFTEVMIRLFVAITNGILLGIILSVGFSMQIQELLMIKTPVINPTLVIIIALVLLIIFGVTVIRATSYLTKQTVANTR